MSRRVVQVREQNPKLTITLEQPRWLKTSLSQLTPEEAARKAAQGEVCLDWLDGLEQEPHMPSTPARLSVNTKVTERGPEKTAYWQEISNKVSSTLHEKSLSPDARIHTAYLLLHHASKERIAGRRRHDHSKLRNDMVRDYNSRKRKFEDAGVWDEDRRKRMDREFDSLLEENRKMRVRFEDVKDTEVPFRALKYVRDITEQQWRKELVRTTTSAMGPTPAAATVAGAEEISSDEELITDDTLRRTKGLCKMGNPPGTPVRDIEEVPEC